MVTNINLVLALTIYETRKQIKITINVKNLAIIMALKFVDLLDTDSDTCTTENYVHSPGWLV
jgi:hypothetical protein